MVLGIFKRYIGPPPIKGDGPTLPPFYIKGVIINYPLYYINYEYYQNVNK